MRWPRWRPWTFAAGSGLALALALPGPGLLPLVLLTPGLLRRALAGVSGWRAFRLGWVAGFAEWVVGVAWVVIVLHRYGGLALPLALLGLGLMAAILGLGWGLVAWGVGRASEPARVWLVPLGLVAFELVQDLPPWIFPWNPVAAGLTASPWLLRPAPVVGATGLSLLVLLVGAGLDALLDRPYRRRGAFLTGVALVVFLVCGALAPAFRPVGAPLRVAAIQPNVPLDVRWDPANEDEIESRVWRLSDQAAAGGAGWIVWPESAVPRTLELDAEYRVAVESFSRNRLTWLTLGSVGLGNGEGEYYNSLYMISPGGLLPWRFDKVHLVPFGEYVPLVGLLPFLKTLVREVSSFTPGRSTLPLPGPVGPIGAAVCYEVAFPALAADEVKSGAGVLVTITNDGWYGDSAAPRQHLALAILRAAENRRYLVRAANTGISAIVDPTGRVVQRLAFGREGLIAAEISAGEGVTPIASWGRALRWTVVLLFLGAILTSLRRPLARPEADPVGADPRGQDA